MTVEARGRTSGPRVAFVPMMPSSLRRSVLLGALTVLFSLGGAASAGAAQFSEIAAGGRATCATTRAGSLFCWGDGRDGQLGRIGTISARVPTRVIGTYDSRQITAGTDFACQILDRGAQVVTRNIYACWGDNSKGQIGNAKQERAAYPQEVRTLGGLTRIEAGTATVCALGPNGTASCWGDNRFGQAAGDGGRFPLLRSPQQVPEVSGLIDLAVGEKHACGVRNDARLVCWGWSNDGQAGVPLTPIIGPEVVPNLDGVVAVTAGAAHTCVLRRTGGGTVWCFGTNERGQLGTGNLTSSGTPLQVPGLSGITNLDAGLLSTCAVGAGGRVWCWGDGSEGKLGTGRLVDSAVPVQVRNLADVVRLSVGDNHACALTSKGTPYCWGSNRFGQIGSGDRTGLTAAAQTPSLVRDEAFGRATFLPRALQSFPSGTSGGTVELRGLVVRKTSSRYRCPSRVRVTLTVGGRSAQRTAVDVSRRSSTACRISGTFPLPARTERATRVRYAVRGTHLRTASATLRAQRTR
jgi:alpha-tubulin suppressor-like RCC1 family protein